MHMAEDYGLHLSNDNRSLHLANHGPINRNASNAEWPLPAGL